MFNRKGRRDRKEGDGVALSCTACFSVALAASNSINDHFASELLSRHEQDSSGAILLHQPIKPLNFRNGVCDPNLSAKNKPV